MILVRTFTQHSVNRFVQNLTLLTRSKDQTNDNSNCKQKQADGVD